MLNAILSGQSGLLFRDLRDKQGLAYTVTSMVWQSRNTGFITLYIGTSPDKVDQSLDGFRKVLTDLAATPLPEEELSRARNILTGEYYQSHQSLISRSRQAASLVTRGFPRNYDDQLIDRAQRVTPRGTAGVGQKTSDPGQGVHPDRHPVTTNHTRPDSKNPAFFIATCPRMQGALYIVSKF